MRNYILRNIALILLLVIISGNQLAANTTPYKNSNFITIDDVLLHYRHWEPLTDSIKGNLFFVHGFGGSTFSWEKVSDTLASIGYYVVAIDVPPFGYSDKSPELNQSISAKADLLNQFLEQVYPGNLWHLAGHSMGGGVVQAMALLNPDKFKSVAFVNAALFSQISKGESLVEGNYLRTLFASIAEDFINNWVISEAMIERQLSSAYGSAPTKEEIEEYIEPLKLPGTATAIISASHYSFEIYDLNAADISIPWIAIWGENDSWVPFKSQKNILSKMNPEVNIAIIDDCGHNPMETHSEEFLKIWLDFLNN